MRKVIFALILFSLVGCKNDASKEDAEPAQIDVEPAFAVTETTHYKVTVEETRELRRASFESKPKKSRIATLSLTVKPIGDEVHFIWSDPDVENLPVDTREQQVDYLIEKFNAMWSPSFAVDKDGKFLRVLDEDLIRAGFEAATSRAIAQAPDPRIAEQIANSRDPVELLTEIGVRRWNEMGGAFLPYRYTYGEPVETELGRFEAVEEVACPTGRCWKFKALTDTSKEELAENQEQLAAMNGRVLSATRELLTRNDTTTMLPTQTQLTFDLTMELPNDLGEKEEGGTKVVELVMYEVVEEEPVRQELSELPSLEPPAGADAGIDSGTSADAGD